MLRYFHLVGATCYAAFSLQSATCYVDRVPALRTARRLQNLNMTYMLCFFFIGRGSVIYLYCKLKCNKLDYMYTL